MKGLTIKFKAMTKLTKEQKKENLTNFLRVFDKEKKYFLHPSDGRLGSKFAVAEMQEGGAINTKSNFMTYEEMNCYFFGILAVQEKKYNF